MWDGLYGNSGNSCAQTEKELAEYEQQEQAEDRYRTQQEPDLRKEQEEYFEGIRRGWRDPGLYENG